MFESQKKAVRKFERSIITTVRKSVMDNEQLLVDYNKRQLEDLGEYADGAIILPLYSPFTVELKRQDGKEFNHVTTKDTGAFHDSFKLSLSLNDFKVIATDSKAELLSRKYDSENHSLLGIQTTFLTEFVNTRTLPALLKQGRKILIK